ncbi:MAG TPA: DUF4159 domain-containing protein [bacterium]
MKKKSIVIFAVIIAFSGAVHSMDIISWAKISAGGAGTDSRDAGIKSLIVEIMKRTNIDIDPEIRLVQVNPALFSFPFVTLSYNSDLRFTALEIKILRDYLLAGGTIFIDNPGGVRGNVFDLAVRREFNKIFSGVSFEAIPISDVIYKSFYLIKFVSGRVIAQPYLDGIRVGGRYAVIYSLNDIFGACAKSSDGGGGWEFDVVPGGEGQREHAIRLAVNIIMYVLTLDYKEDMVHKPFILRRESK